MAQFDPPIGAAARTLVLMRHAAAGGAGRDHDRPLTPDGVRTATDAGRWLRANLAPVDLTICSSATRTRQTRSAADVAGDVRYSDELYGGGIDDILDQIATAPPAVTTLLVVGHAPTIPSLAGELVTQARLNAGEETGSDDDVRHFAAGTFAVLTTEAQWADLGEAGAQVRTVRHPTH